MKPYFETHAIGALYLVGVLGWYLMELVQLLLQRQWRKTAHRVGPRSFWPAFWVGAAVVVAMLFAAPKIAPGAAMGLPAVGFAVGMVMLVTGVALRLWAFHALGQYFTFSVKVSPDQPVVTAGPYRLLRHPGYAAECWPQSVSDSCGETGPAPRLSSCSRWPSLSGASALRRAPCSARSATATAVTPRSAIVSFRSSGSQRLNAHVRHEIGAVGHGLEQS